MDRKSMFEGATPFPGPIYSSLSAAWLSTLSAFSFEKRDKLSGARYLRAELALCTPPSPSGLAGCFGNFADQGQVGGC